MVSKAGLDDSHWKSNRWHVLGDYKTLQCNEYVEADFFKLPTKITDMHPDNVN